MRISRGISLATRYQLPFQPLARNRARPPFLLHLALGETALSWAPLPAHRGPARAYGVALETDSFRKRLADLSRCFLFGRRRFPLPQKAVITATYPKHDAVSLLTENSEESIVDAVKWLFAGKDVENDSGI